MGNLPSPGLLLSFGGLCCIRLTAQSSPNPPPAEEEGALQWWVWEKSLVIVPQTPDFLPFQSQPAHRWGASQVAPFFTTRGKLVSRERETPESPISCNSDQLYFQWTSVCLTPIGLSIAPKIGWETRVFFNSPSSQALPQIGFKTEMRGRNFVEKVNISFTKKKIKPQRDART